jgi:hypothetical protein
MFVGDSVPSFYAGVAQVLTTAKGSNRMNVLERHRYVAMFGLNTEDNQKTRDLF